MIIVADLTTSNSGNVQMESLFRICRVTTPSSTVLLSTPTVCLSGKTKQSDLLTNIALWQLLAVLTTEQCASGTGRLDTTSKNSKLQSSLDRWTVRLEYSRWSLTTQGKRRYGGFIWSVFDEFCRRSRLITCEADKTIKIYKEDDSATEESHPINWKPDILKRRRY